MKFLLILVALSSQVFGYNHGRLFHQRSLLTHSLSENVRYMDLRTDGSLRSMDTDKFDQKLDHFNDSDTRTFKQRYFVDSHYAEGSASPVFLIICGEWNCAGTGSYGFVENLAKKFKAHLVALEHRYYGESAPFGKLTNENLAYLSIENAIEDLANFQRSIAQAKGLSGKWIAAGGSYAGTLSAFYRLKHPELVIGSLASSAPVLTKAEFFEYDAHIAKVLNKSTCGDKVREAVAQIEKRLSEDPKSVRELFKAQDVTRDDDFLYVVADMLAAAVQYGRDKIFCDALLGATDPVVGYAQGGLKVLSSMGETPLELSMQTAEKIDVSSSDYFRQWMWQSCREFGWFQVANSERDRSSRSPKVDLLYHKNVCERLYQRPMSEIGSLNTDWYSNLFRPDTNRIIFTNGGNDPWQTLSVVEGGPNQNAGFDLFLMDGAAHCSDLKALTSLPSVLEAQGRIEGVIKSWLAL